MDKELILKKIESCREAWQTARTFVPGRNSRTAIYTYLAIVFALYQELRDSKGAKRAAAFLIRKFNLQLNKQSHPLAALIAASCREEKKAQSRYVRCLRYARAHRNLWLHQMLEDFLQANGGVAGCAQKACGEDHASGRALEVAWCSAWRAWREGHGLDAAPCAPPCGRVQEGAGRVLEGAAIRNTAP